MGVRVSRRECAGRAPSETPTYDSMDGVVGRLKPRSGGADNPNTAATFRPSSDDQLRC